MMGRVGLCRRVRSRSHGVSDTAQEAQLGSITFWFEMGNRGVLAVLPQHEAIMWPVRFVTWVRSRSLPCHALCCYNEGSSPPPGEVAEWLKAAVC